jgi:hypothetical protein
VKWVALGIVLSLAPAYLASAQNAGVKTHVSGIGTRSCAYWQSTPASINEGTAWIFGFWTGMNFGNSDNHFIGAQTDGPGIIAEVKKICNERPSNLLSFATIATYDAMAGR